MHAALVGAAELRVGRQRPDHERSIANCDPAQLVEAREVQDPVRWLPGAAGDLDQEIRAARNGPPRSVGQQRVGGLEGPGRFSRRLVGECHGSAAPPAPAASAIASTIFV